MRIIIIDTHGSPTVTRDATNVHARNSLILSKYLGAELLTSIHDKDIIREKLRHEYDRVVFVHASPYTEANELAKGCLNSLNAKYFYITNEYNLGEPVALWVLTREHGIRYEVIANHKQEGTGKLKPDSAQGQFMDKWHVLNLNSLIYGRVKVHQDLFGEGYRLPLIYFGAVRKDRMEYVRKYADKRLTISTSSKNQAEYKANGIEANYVSALRWHGERNKLSDFIATIYLEDRHTHSNYNYLANRFYEALSFNTVCFFDESCRNTIEQSGYPIDEWLIVKDKEELHKKIQYIRDNGYIMSPTLHEIAEREKQETLKKIKQIIWG